MNNKSSIEHQFSIAQLLSNIATIPTLQYLQPSSDGREILINPETREAALGIITEFENLGRQTILGPSPPEGLDAMIIRAFMKTLRYMYIFSDDNSDKYSRFMEGFDIPTARYLDKWGEWVR